MTTDMQLYIHIPFCKSKCLYCDFKSFPNCTESAVFDYLTTLNREIKLASNKFKDRKITTIYIGGGTPSLLGVDDFLSIAQCLKDNFNLDNVVEWTIECNPESITEEKLKCYRESGVNRISIGIQSLDDRNLKSMGRIHTRDMAISKLKLASNYFDNISADFIVGLPYDDEKVIIDEIGEIAPYVQHISVYTLQLEDGTSLYKLVKNGKIVLPDDDTTCDYFAVARDTLKKCGFERYEVSNFAKDKKYSIHNNGYWQRIEYLGLGLNASSFIKENCEMRYKNYDNFADYEKSVNSATDYPFVETEQIDDNAILEEKIMLGLRLTSGIEKSLLKDKMDLINTQFADYFNIDDNKIAFNDKGMDVMNYILCQLI